MTQLRPENVTEQIRNTVAEVLRIPTSEVSAQSRLFEELGADSLTSVEILAVLDNKYGLDLPEEKLAQIDTFSQLAELVLSELKKKSN